MTRPRGGDALTSGPQLLPGLSQRLAAYGLTMDAVRLTGQLLCRTEDEARIVDEHLPEHITRTRAEPGCMHFDVVPTREVGVWQVDEVFDGAPAFRAHQERVAASTWGRVTAGIERRYLIEGLSD